MESVQVGTGAAQVTSQCSLSFEKVHDYTKAI